jgi:uncharacterized protein YjbI with pentapeptide repeats
MNILDKHGNVVVTISVDSLREQQIFNSGQRWGDPYLVDKDFTRSTLWEIDIQRGDFSGTTLDHVTFSNCVFRHVSFVRARGNNVTFKADSDTAKWVQSCNFDNSEFIDCDFSKLIFQACTFIGANFTNSKFGELDFTERDLTGTKFIDIEFKSLRLTGANLTDADFSCIGTKEKNTNPVIFDGKDTQLIRTKLDGLRISEQNLSPFTIESLSLKQCSIYRCTFSSVQIKQIEWAGAEISDVNFAEQDLSGLDLTNVRFKYNNPRYLSKTKFDGANLNGVWFRKLDLLNTDITTAADLQKIVFDDVKMDFSKLSGKNLTGVQFNNCNIEPYNPQKETAEEAGKADINESNLGNNASQPQSNENGSQKPDGGNVENSENVYLVFEEGTNLSSAKFTNINLEWKANGLASDPQSPPQPKAPILNYVKFQGANLQNACFQRVDLSTTKFEKCILKGIDFSHTKWGDVDFIGQDLSGCKFDDADFLNVDFSYANLTNVSFKDAKNLTVEHLKGANLKNATLPDYLSDFKLVDKIDDRIKDSGKFFLVLLGASLYAALTAWVTNDLKILANSTEAQLPVLAMAMLPDTFFKTVPILLFILHAYFLVELQRLWKAIAQLPAVFPDGRTIEERIYPWVVTSFAYSHIKHIQDKKPDYGGSIKYFVPIMVWWIPPVAQVLVFWKATHLQDSVIAVFGILCSIFTFGFASYDHHKAVVTLTAQSEAKTEQSPSNTSVQAKLKSIFSLSVVKSVLCCIVLLGGIWGGLSKPNLSNLNVPFVQIRSGQSSSSPASIMLRGKSLRGVQMENAILPNADMKGCDLSGANLTNADLRGANLRNIKIDDKTTWSTPDSNNKSKRCDLSGADFSGTHITEECRKKIDEAQWKEPPVGIEGATKDHNWGQ